MTSSKTFIPEGVFFIKSKLSGLVLDAKGEGQNNGTKVIVWEQKVENNLNQKWQFKKNFTIENLGNGLVLDYNYSFSDEEVVCWQYTLNKKTQLWAWDGTFITNKHSGKVLDVARESKKKGASVIVYEKHGKANQQWDLVSTFMPQPPSEQQ